MVKWQRSDPIGRTTAVASPIGNFTPRPDGRLRGAAISSPTAQAESLRAKPAIRARIVNRWHSFRRLRRRPESVLGDKGYDSCSVRRELRRRRILPVISRRGAPNIKGLGKLRYVVEQTFALLHQFKRLAVRWERRLDLHNAFVPL
ncbi:transposase [Streptomyces sp. NBC_01800]|uniref:transposase n=1 Tax=Streptomyces sp. NBC_01800 TaxID=2975945 RepID=UPI003FA38060